MLAGLCFAAPEETPQQGIAQKEKPPPSPPTEVSPARPEIKPPVPVHQCEHCCCCCCCGTAGHGKPWAKDEFYRPLLGQGRGKAAPPKVRILHEGGEREFVRERRHIRRKAHHGKGFATWRFLEHARELGLSEEQKTKLKDIAFNTKQEMIDLKAALQKEKLQLKKLLSAEEPSPREIKRQLEAIAQAEVNIKYKRITSMIEAKNVLTEEQRELLREKRQCCRHEECCGGPHQVGIMVADPPDACLDIFLGEHAEQQADHACDLLRLQE